MPKSKALAVRLPIETWNHLNDEARRKGMTLSNLARTKLMISSEFDGPIQACVDDFSKRLGISRHRFLEAVLVDFMARISTCRSGGEDGHIFLPQFVFTDQGLLGGKRLFEHMRAHYAREMPGTAVAGGTAPESEAPAQSFAGRIDADLDESSRPETGGATPGGGATTEIPGEETATDHSKLERARMDQAMFDRIMQHYGKKGAASESSDDETDSQ